MKNLLLKFKPKFSLIIFSLLMFYPFSVFASIPVVGCTLGTGGPVKFQHLLTYASCIINESVIPLIFALAVTMFVWGVVQFVINSSEEAKKEKGRQFMIWGIIALAVMTSVWGLVAILGNTFNIDTTIIPQVQSPP